MLSRGLRCLSVGKRLFSFAELSLVFDVIYMLQYSWVLNALIWLQASF